MRNESVPSEAIIRQLVKENKQLKLQVRELKNKLQCKENAIEAFKEWQVKYAENRVKYWLNQGIELAQLKDKIDKKELEHIKTVLFHYDKYKRQINKLDHIVKQIENGSLKILEDVKNHIIVNERREK